MSGLEVGRSDPRILVRVGPLVRVTVGATQTTMKPAKALVDTGAQACFIHADFARTLGLETIDRHDVSDIYEAHLVDSFKAYITIDGDLPIESPRFLFGYPRRRWDFDVILGRDVLSRLQMRYDGPSGSVRLHAPRVEALT